MDIQWFWSCQLGESRTIWLCALCGRILWRRSSFSCVQRCIRC
ncbi:MAG: hypothetical protein KBF57_09040 [Saprospiraceae bacterium]|nr:hypothetical protein [Saprospiraceae bacterium]MBP9194818.1 hypothetical protein [Saprospiraceae bacterium]